MERFEEAVPLYLKACEVEGKTERTVQSYAETLRHFRRAVDQLQLPNSVESLRAGPCLSLHGLGAGARREAPVPSTAASVRSRRSSPGAGAWTMWRRTRSCGCRW